MTTRVVSVWRPDPGSALGVAPDASLPRLSAADAVRVADYLDGGAVVARTTARMVDPWSSDPQARVSLTQRTDGVWRWDDAVGYFVRHYHLNPGSEFVEDLRARGFVAPSVSSAQVSAVADEIFGAPEVSASTRSLRLDGSQLLPSDTYCIYQGRVFRCDVDTSRIKLIVSPGETIPDGFEHKIGRPGAGYKMVPQPDVSAFYKVMASCRYKGTPFSIRTIDGPLLGLMIGGGRRVQLPEQPAPTINEWPLFPNAEDFGNRDIRATIDIVEAARVTMAVVPYHLVGGYLKPVRDVTGAGYSVPRADEIFYFPSPADSPYLPPGQALAVVRQYLGAHDRGYPVGELVPVRLRDGWQMATASAVDTLYYVDDDGQILPAPASVAVGVVSSQLSAQFRLRHPFVDPPPAHDSGTDIFD